MSLRARLTRNRAGVAGLTTALLLSRLPGYSIVVAAKHMPGDYDIEYASPWAGANYMPYVLGTYISDLLILDAKRSLTKRLYPWHLGCRLGQAHLEGLR